MGAKKISLLFMVIFFVFTLAVGQAIAFPQGEGGGGAAPGAGGGISGKVVETMDSGGYTYILLENEGTKTWAALPQTKVAVGEEVTLKPGMVMPSFTSKTLNRTFENIVFSGGLMK